MKNNTFKQAFLLTSVGLQTWDKFFMVEYI